jgi:CheY-like chemotaxis protein
MNAGAAGILVIDDEPVLRTTFQYLLEEQGFRVWTAENGQDGIELSSRVHPDLVITDIVMPELDGFETIRRLRAKSPSLPIIAMSAAMNEPDMERPIEDGPYCCVRKPIDGDMLVELVRAILEPDPVPAM